MVRLKLVLLFVCLTSWVALFGQQRPGIKVPVIDRAQMFDLLKINDDTLRVFNFWATWCRPCVQELPYFEELNQKLSKGQFRQYLISLDFNDDKNQKLVKFIEKHQLQSDVLLFDGGDPNQWIDQIHPQWSGTIPASIVLQKGEKCFVEGSFENYNALYDFIQRCKNTNKI